MHCKLMSLLTAYIQNIYGKQRVDWVFAGGRREPRWFSRWMRSTCAPLISLLLSVMKRLGVKRPITPPHLNIPKPVCFVFSTHCWTLSQRVSSFGAVMFVFECLDSGLLSAKYNGKWSREFPPVSISCVQTEHCWSYPLHWAQSAF